MFRFHSFYKLLNMRYTESDIISHLQDKTELNMERNSSLGQDQLAYFTLLINKLTCFPLLHFTSLRATIGLSQLVKYIFGRPQFETHLLIRHCPYKQL